MVDLQARHRSFVIIDSERHEICASLVSVRARLNQIFASKFVRNAGSLMLYTIMGQVTTVVASFALTRIYAPREFGTFGLLLSFPALLGNVISINFHIASPAPMRDEDGAAIAFGSILITVVMSILLSLVFVALILTNQLGFGALPLWSWTLVWAMLLLTGLSGTFQYWCVRKQKFRTLGEGIVALNSARALLQLGLGLISVAWTGLIWGEIGGRIAQLSRYFVVAGKDLYAHRSSANFYTISATLMRYKKFATVLLPPQFLESAWAAIPVPIFNLLYGLSPTGQYYLMRRVLDLPVAFISNTVGDAFYGKISEFARTDPSRIRKMLIMVFLTLVAVSAIGFAPLMLLGPTLFVFIFGEPWRQAGLLAAIMAAPMILQIGTSPVARVFGVTSRPSLRYPFTLVEMLGGSTTFILAWHYHFSMVWTVTGLSLVHILSYLVYIGTAYVAAGHIDSDANAQLS